MNGQTDLKRVSEYLKDIIYVGFLFEQRRKLNSLWVVTKVFLFQFVNCFIYGNCSVDDNTKHTFRQGIV